MEVKVVTYNGLTLDLSQVKCFKQEDCFYGKKNSMIVVFKTRYDYIKNPKTGKFIKQKYNETVEFDFPDFETPRTIIADWREIWEKYLETQSL